MQKGVNMNIGIYWTDEISDGWTDIFSDSDFENECKNKLFIHPVTHKSEKNLFATCLKTVCGVKVRLDYRPFALTNASEEMLLGIMNFDYDGKRKSLKNLSWTDNGSLEKEPAQYKLTYPRRKPKIPQRIFDLLSCEDIDEKSSYFEDVNAAFTDKARQKSINTKVFIRNPIVVKLALKRASGKCEKCSNDAPFISKVTKQPYLEVHHVIPLSKNGPDTLANVMAICPNCHREIHFGIA